MYKETEDNVTSMDRSSFERYIKSRFEDQLQWYSKRASADKRAYQIYQTGIGVLSAIVTVTVGIGLHYRDNVAWPIASLIASATVALLTGLQKTFRFRENWVEYRTTAEDLKKERHYHILRCGDYARHESPDQLFVERVEAMISQQNTRWNVATLKSESDHEPDE